MENKKNNKQLLIELNGNELISITAGGIFSDLLSDFQIALANYIAHSASSAGAQRVGGNFF